MNRKWILTLCFMSFFVALTSTTAFSASIKGSVVSTMNSGGYTYVEVDDGKAKHWAAVPQTTIAVGAKVEIPTAPPMRNFTSKSLNKTFNAIYFVSALKIEGATPTTLGGQAVPAGHPPLPDSSSSPASFADPSSITKAEGGYTVEEVYKKVGELKGKKISVRGKVVKFSESIMGKNWAHLVDGTGQDGENDLTVTTQQVIKKGDTVTVEGVVAQDKNFGGGYFYKVILEEGTFKAE